MRLDPLSLKVFKTISEYHLVDSYNTVIVGVSGGPDSVALLKVLHTINRLKGLRLSLRVVHINHQLRENASEEEQFVRSLADSLSLPVTVAKIHIREVASQTKLSVEETARLERYKFFAQMAKQYNVSTVALGHTADDNAETILHRLIRGTGLLGIAGIPIKRPLTTAPEVHLIRPLLFIWKKEILKYLEENQQDYRIDPSNHETVYFRNKIRLELIPFLENRYNPGIKASLIQLSQIASANNEYLQQEASVILRKITLQYDERGYCINTVALSKYPRILQYRVLQEILNAMHIPLKEINYRHYTRMLDEMAKTGKGRSIHLPGRVHVWHEHGTMSFRKGDSIESSGILPEIIIQVPGITPVYPLGHITSEILDRRDINLEDYKRSKGQYEEIFDLKSIVMPVTARKRKEGDMIFPLGARGRKKVKDLLIDKKIPVKSRDSVIIVSMNGQPIWVVGLCMDDRVKVRSDTERILKLTFNKDVPDA